MRTTRFLQPASRAVAVPASLSSAARSKSEFLAKKRILVTGANGQIGSELIGLLRGVYGKNHVVATDIAEPPVMESPFRLLNVVDRSSIEKVVLSENIGTILHLAAIMSVRGEANPHLCMELGIDAVQHMFEVARVHNCRLYIPSSIAAFSPESGKHIANDKVQQNPTTIYGITKVFAEQLGSYYNQKFGTDFRSLRYPGILSAATLPGGGTTDYAVWMYHYALQKKKYACPLPKDAALPMMYLPDCMDSTVAALEAPRESLTKCVYNISAMSFTPEQVADSIRKVIPSFEVDYVPQPVPTAIAASWPASMCDDAARRDFKWQPKYDLDKMSADMIKEISQLYESRGKIPLP